MKKSRHGLTRCPACRAHVRAGESPSTTECPFCGANLREGRARVAIAAGRGGLLAASLLALSACGASSSGEGTTAPATEPITTEDNQNTEGEDHFDPPPSEEPTPVEAYGIAPSDRPEGPPDEPLYGLPPE